MFIASGSDGHYDCNSFFEGILYYMINAWWFGHNVSVVLTGLDVGQQYIAEFYLSFPSDHVVTISSCVHGNSEYKLLVSCT